jgi:hypothetical protein
VALLFNVGCFQVAAVAIPPRGLEPGSKLTRRSTEQLSTAQGNRCRTPDCFEVLIRNKELSAMATDTNSLTEVLHSDNHSKLSSEEIAKAVARHNKNHSAAKEENLAAKGNKGKKK